MKQIDLRSDTVSQPTPAMRSAMKSAQLGDDVFGEDPTINRLQEMAAEITGKPAGLFLPTGTMSNACAILAHCERGDQIIVGRNSHIFLEEQGGLSVLAAAFPTPIDEAPDGSLPLDQVEASIQPVDDHRVISKLIAIENTHNVRGGQPIDLAYTQQVSDLARRHGLKLHIDGARLFNAAVALGTPASELCAPADSVTFCVSKGLCAPVGSLLCGDEDFITRARRARKLLGGGMRQAGVLAAAAIVALTTMVDRLEGDHQNAKKLAEGLADIPGIILDPAMVRTNMVYFGLAPEVPCDAAEFAAALRDHDILIGPTHARRLRACTYYWITPVMIERVLQTIRELIVLPA